MEDNIAFKKWDNGEKNLIITFAGNGWHVNWDGKLPIFEFGRSLSNMELPCDISFLRDTTNSWYLGGLEGIGENIDHTISFLKNETQNYDKVICIGASSGGYGSLLFGSLINAYASLAFIPQTDLQWIFDIQCPSNRPKWKPLCNASKLEAFDKYSNLNAIINSTTQYFIHSYTAEHDVLHGPHHYENISEFPNVNRLDQRVTTMIKNGGLEAMLKSLLDNGDGS